MSLFSWSAARCDSMMAVSLISSLRHSKIVCGFRESVRAVMPFIVWMAVRHTFVIACMAVLLSRRYSGKVHLPFPMKGSAGSEIDALTIW